MSSNEKSKSPYLHPNDHDLTCKQVQCSARKHREQNSKYNYMEGVKIKIKNQ